ncbi:MAG: hypothetical protein WAM09_04390 [Anaerolineales bacterium]
MKKVTLLSLVLILLAVSVVPVMAAGPNNGHGNGGSAGQGNSAGNQDQTRQQDQDSQQYPGRNANNGVRGNGNREHARVRTPFYLQGTITATTASTITVTLIHGNAQVKQYFSTGLTVQITASTKLFKLTHGGDGEDTAESGVPATSEESPAPNSDEDTPGNRVPTTPDQLQIGRKVAIHGNVVANVFNATLITVYIQTIVLPPG